MPFYYRMLALVPI
ncbi:uncharacterized protein FFE2_16074 [Fusarium fujikuroi]|nr:uncharacterized protein FFE2_16074 [Fusarium fujikuroi]